MERTFDRSYTELGVQDDLRELLKPDVVYRIKPHSRLAYAWDSPAASNRKIYLNCNKGVRLIDIMEIGVLPPLKVRIKVHFKFIS